MKEHKNPNKSLTTIIAYNNDTFHEDKSHFVNDETITNNQLTKWINTFGNTDTDFLKEVINKYSLDPFVLNLLNQDYERTRIVELENCFYLTIRSFHSFDKDILLEQICFVVAPDFIWSIQELKGDAFDEIRTHLKDKKGHLRQKEVDFLLYQILDEVINSYYDLKTKLFKQVDKEIGLLQKQEQQISVDNLERIKRKLLLTRKAIFNIKETLAQFPKIEDTQHFSLKYFIELKEQSLSLIDAIDHELHRIDSTINLFFSYQGHKLNQIMKMLTIVSVIFIPLTFLAGIYGMNFANIPELSHQYGYFIILGVMFLITITSIVFFKRKKWF